MSAVTIARQSAYHALFCLVRVCRLPSLLSEYKDALSTRKSRLTIAFARCRRQTPISDRSPSDRQPARFTFSFRRAKIVRERVPDGPGCCSTTLRCLSYAARLDVASSRFLSAVPVVFVAYPDRRIARMPESVPYTARRSAHVSDRYLC